MTELNLQQFQVADFNASGQLLCSERYSYEALEKLPEAPALLGLFAGCLWNSPQQFETRLLDWNVDVRWRQTGSLSGIATFWERGGRVLQLSLVLGGGDADDAAQLAIVQQHLINELHDTGFEPAFDLQRHVQRPLLVSIALQTPASQDAKWAFALADRCLAAAVFRKQQVEPWLA